MGPTIKFGFIASRSFELCGYYEMVFWLGTFDRDFKPRFIVAFDCYECFDGLLDCKSFIVI